MPALLAMGCLRIVKTIIFIFNFDLFLNFSSPFVLRTFSPQEGERFFVGCRSLNPSLLCGEVPASLAMGCLRIVKTIIFIFNLFLNFSSPLSTSLTFPLKEGKDSAGCYFLNPSLLCGEVPHRGDGVLVNCKNFLILIKFPLVNYVDISPLRSGNFGLSLRLSAIRW